MEERKLDVREEDKVIVFATTRYEALDGATIMCIGRIVLWHRLRLAR